MRMKRLSALAILMGVISPAIGLASDDHNLKEVCKAECPAAKDEHEAHKCMKEVAKKKKDDKKFRKSDCFAALREHEKHEKEEGHKH